MSGMCNSFDKMIYNRPTVGSLVIIFVPNCILLWVTVPDKRIELWNVRLSFEKRAFQLHAKLRAARWKADGAENKMCRVQCVTQPPSIGSLLSLSTHSPTPNQQPTVTKQRTSCSSLSEKRRTSKQTAGVLLLPPAEAQQLRSLEEDSLRAVLQLNFSSSRAPFSKGTISGQPAQGRSKVWN